MQNVSETSIIFRMRRSGHYSYLILLVSIGLLFFSVSGCARSRNESDLSSGLTALVISADDYDSAWDEIVEVLREHYFIPDRQDRRTGIIITHPCVSQQWFEFWRDDARGWYQWAESSLHTIRRIAEIRFIPKGNDKIEIKVKVTVQRKNQPQRQATTASGAIQAFRQDVPTYTGKPLKPSEMTEWTNLGEDVKLEEYLLAQIHKRLTEAQPVYRK